MYTQVGLTLDRIKISWKIDVDNRRPLKTLHERYIQITDHMLRINAGRAYFQDSTRPCDSASIRRLFEPAIYSGPGVD